MRRVVVSFLLAGTVFLKGFAVHAYPYPFSSAYDRIMVAVAQRDEKALKEMVSRGININARNPSGQTALCTTLERRDVEGYQMLFRQGATIHVPCIRQIPPETLAEFYRSNPDMGRYVNGAILVPTSEASERSVWLGALPWPHVGEFLLAGAAVGFVALIGSGGKNGSGGGGGYDPSLFKAIETGISPDDFPALNGYWKNPSLTFTATDDGKSARDNYNEYALKYREELETNNPQWDEADQMVWEYNSGSDWNYFKRVLKPGEYVATETIYLMNPVAQLPMVKAAAAWARGYTGYEIDRSDAENPKIDKTKKIKAAVMDSGLEVGQFAHNQLGVNISTSYRLNFNYGPCSKMNSTKCWALYTDSEGESTAYLISGTNPIIDEAPTSYQAFWPIASLQKWNEYAGQFAPICNGGGENCLRFIGSSEVIYYPVGVEYDPDSEIIPEGVIRYTVANSKLKDEYETKYGADGYVYNEYDPTPGLLQDNDLWNSENHGTHVAGIIAAIQDAEDTVGIAPNAEIIPVRVDFQMNQVMNYLQQVVQQTDAQVINLSLGTHQYISSKAEDNNDLWNSFSDDVQAGYKAAAEKGTVLVFAAGNEGKTQPHSYTVAPLVGESDNLKENYSNSIYKNLLISVVAVDENRKIADFGEQGGVKYSSNRCGASSMYCLAAPGGSSKEAVGSTGLGDGRALAAGTSQAAPIVTGSVALLMGAFPFLKPQEVVQILFETADYLKPTEAEIFNYNKAAGDENAYAKNTEEVEEGGETKGYNAIYGHGLVNLEKATDPVEVPKIHFDTVASSDAAIDAPSTSTTVPASFAHALSVLPQNIVVLDKYTRPYDMPVSSFVHKEKRTDALKRSFQSFMASDEKVVDAGDKLSFGFTAAPSDSVGLPTGSMTMQMKPTTDMSFKMGYSQDTKSFGGTYADRIVQNPFVNMRQAWGTDIAYRVAGHLSLTGGFKYGQNGFIDSDTLDKMSDKPMVSVMQTGLRYAPKKSVVFDVSFGQMDEEESLLGLRGSGAFKTDGNKTKFVSMGATIMPFEKWQLSASYTYGVTQANDTQTLMKFSRLKSDAFALAALYRPDETKTYGFKLASPLRVRSGTVTFDLPTARDMYEDKLYRTQYTSRMKPDAREYDLSFFFMNQLSPALLVAGESGVRLNPDHQKDAKPDWQTLFKLQYQY